MFGSRCRPLLGSVAVLALFALAAASAACGSAPPSRPATTPPGSPGGAGASGGPGPLVTPWPGNTVRGIEALGVADGEIRKAINDFSQGVATEDLALIRRAADGLAGLGVLLDNAADIEHYPPTQPLAEKYGEVVPQIVDAATRLRGAIDARDSGAIAPAAQDLTEALSAYAEFQPELGAWVVQVPEQKRMLVR